MTYFLNKHNLTSKSHLPGRLVDFLTNEKDPKSEVLFYTYEWASFKTRRQSLKILVSLTIIIQPLKVSKHVN